MATAGALFMYLADEIGEQAWLTQIDLAAAQFLHAHGTPGPCACSKSSRFLWVTCLRYPGASGRFSTADRRRLTCGSGLAHRVQPDLPRCTLPQRRHRWLRGCGRLAHLLHPPNRPDAKKVEHPQSTLTRRHSGTRRPYFDPRNHFSSSRLSRPVKALKTIKPDAKKR
jgi:hypothetical protein